MYEQVRATLTMSQLRANKNKINGFYCEWTKLIIMLLMLVLLVV